MSNIPPQHRRLEEVEKQLKNPSSELNIDGLLVSTEADPEDVQGGHMVFHIGLYRENHEKIFLSETIRPRALIFSM